MAASMGTPRFKMTLISIIKDGQHHTKVVNLPVNSRNEVYVGKTYLDEMAKLAGEINVEICCNPNNFTVI